MFSSFFLLFFDAILFIYLALLGGVFVDKIIPKPTEYETPIWNLLWLTLQILLGIFILFLLDDFYSRLVQRETNRYFGLVVFNILFFLVQPQIFLRLYEFYKHLTGIDIGRDIRKIR